MSSITHVAYLFIRSLARSLCLIYNKQQMTKEKVLIVGGGFGGVKAALELADDDHFEITLLSEDTDLRYYPSLYHTATGGRRANSSIPLQTIFASKSVQLAQGSAKTIDRKAK